ncbi:MAG: hypothetical protein K0R00_829 [Herbinix sp.]|nr:hypothetical protein [Herbinix sp.]
MGITLGENELDETLKKETELMETETNKNDGDEIKTKE